MFLPETLIFCSESCITLRLFECGKDNLIPARHEDRVFPPKVSGRKREGTFFFASLRASLTAETAVALPVFFFCMLFVLQLTRVYGTAARFSAAMVQTGEEMAVAAYASEYGDSDSVIAAALSDAFAHARTVSLAGTQRGTRNVNFLLSTYLEEDDLIDLVMTYQMKSPTGLVKAPWSFFVQRCVVRGWTGRKGSSGKDSSKDKDGGEGGGKVYVTDHGTVYHTDSHCSHIHLHISQTTPAQVKGLRNTSGEKYHACELCGGGGDTLYITEDGNRYHSSLTCSGLKRTVREMTREEAAEHLRPCSKCGGGA